MIRTDYELEKRKSASHSFMNYLKMLADSPQHFLRTRYYVNSLSEYGLSLADMAILVDLVYFDNYAKLSAYEDAEAERRKAADADDSKDSWQPKEKPVAKPK